jgi:Mn2+/Fe2+ NRAMP family transporter
MGAFANSRFTSILAWTVAAAILGFNFELLWLTLRPA